MKTQTKQKAEPSKSNGEAKKGTIKPSSDAASGLMELFEDSLKDIYWAEKALTKAIPKMGKNATSAELIDALNMHLKETEEQIVRLESVFKSIDKKATAKKCDAMEGLIKEGESIMEETEPGVVRDAGIIAAAQKSSIMKLQLMGHCVNLLKR